MSTLSMGQLAQRAGVRIDTVRIASAMAQRGSRQAGLHQQSPPLA